MHKAYHSVFLARAQAAIGAARAVGPIEHAVLKGQLREIVVRDLLGPALPRGVGIGSGQIVSAYGDTSTQQDVILYDPSILPSAVFEGEIGLFPLESVLIGIEVKSRITAQELRSSDLAASRLATFRYAPPVGQDAYPAGHEIEAAVSLLLAFDSDLQASPMGEVDRYDGLRDRANPPSIRGLCVAESGFWFWTPDGWIQWPTDEVGTELLNFLSAIINTIDRIHSTRRRPDARSYLLRHVPSHVTQSGDGT